MSIETKLYYHPEFIEVEQLVKLGLYKDRKEFSLAKSRGDSPPCTKITQKRWVIAKEDLIKWLKERGTQQNSDADALEPT